MLRGMSPGRPSLVACFSVATSNLIGVWAKPQEIVSSNSQGLKVIRMVDF